MRGHYQTFNYQLTEKDKRVAASRTGTMQTIDLTCSEPFDGLHFRAVVLSLTLEHIQSLRDMCNEILEDWNG